MLGSATCANDSNVRRNADARLANSGSSFAFQISGFRFQVPAFSFHFSIPKILNSPAFSCSHEKCALARLPGLH